SASPMSSPRLDEDHPERKDGRRVRYETRTLSSLISILKRNHQGRSTRRLRVISSARRSLLEVFVKSLKCRSRSPGGRGQRGRSTSLKSGRRSSRAPPRSNPSGTPCSRYFVKPSYYLGGLGDSIGETPNHRVSKNAIVKMTTTR